MRAKFGGDENDLHDDDDDDGDEENDGLNWGRRVYGAENRDFEVRFLAMHTFGTPSPISSEKNKRQL